MNSIIPADLKLFQEFYANLESKKDIFYMYFTGNLLHYALESTALIPNEVNLVLITSDLTQREIQTIQKIIHRPHINLPNKYHDGYIWDMLIENNEFDFGWIDVDCFIFNPQIFKEMKIFTEDNIAINTVWARKYDEYCVDYYFANTYFLFVNISIYKHVTSLYHDVTMMPSVYNTQSDKIVFEAYKTIGRKLFNSLKIYYNKLDICLFDTTHLYQMLFYISGFKINRIRNLDQISTYYSQEALHLGGCHLIHRYILDDSLKRLYFRFNMRLSFHILYRNLFLLPEEYQRFFLLFKENMIKNKIDTNIDDVVEKIKSYAERNNINLSIISGR